MRSPSFTLNILTKWKSTLSGTVPERAKDKTKSSVELLSYLLYGIYRTLSESISLYLTTDSFASRHMALRAGIVIPDDSGMIMNSWTDDGMAKNASPIFSWILSTTPGRNSDDAPKWPDLFDRISISSEICSSDDNTSSRLPINSASLIPHRMAGSFAAVFDTASANSSSVSQ